MKANEVKVKKGVELVQHLIEYYHAQYKWVCTCVFLATASTASLHHDPAGYYMFKDNNRNTKTRCEICSELTMNTPERRHWRRSGVFIVNFEHISHLALVFLLLNLSK